MDDETQAAIAWVQQRARELAPECDTAEEFLAAFGTPSACARCGKLGLADKAAGDPSWVCDECVTGAPTGSDRGPIHLL